MNGKCIFKSWNGPYKVYPRWAQHILNKTYTSIAPWSDGIQLYVDRCCCYLVYRDWLLLLSCPCVLVGCSFTRSFCFHCAAKVCAACWFALYKRFYATAAAAAAVVCSLVLFFFFVRSFALYSQIHRHTLVLLYFASFSCVLNILYWLGYDLMDQREESVATCYSNRQLRNLNF